MEPHAHFENFLQYLIDFEGSSEFGIKAKEMLNDFKSGDKVCLLKKSLYGLKQAGRSWYIKLNDTLQKLGAIPTKSDPCLFKIGTGDEITLLAIYVDDFLIAGRNQKGIDNLGKQLANEFEIRDIGPVSYCLGVEFFQQNDIIKMTQQGYIIELLNKFVMIDSKPVTTPIDVNTKLKKEENPTPEEQKLPYRELIGGLTYLSVTTRPDIAYSISMLGQFNNCYGFEHWKAAKRVLRYLEGTSSIGITYKKDLKPIQGFIDADWGGCIEDRRSYSVYIFTFGGGPISWDSRKQRTVALSTTEAKYIAMTESIKEAIYLQRLVKELGFEQLGHLTIFCDNRSCISLAENPTFHSRTKHIDIRYHFI